MNDCVFTPSYVTDALLDLNILDGCTSLLEPCAGDGAIVRTVRRRGFDWFIGAIEINNDFAEDLYESNPTSVTIRSFLDEKITPETHGKYDAVIINPPYSCTDDVIKKAFTFLNPGGRMAVLLRMQHLTGVKRRYLIESLPPTSVHIFIQRPALTLSVADIGGYCWVIWDNPLTKVPTTLRWFDHKGEKRIDDRTFDNQKQRVREVVQRRPRGNSRITEADIPHIRTSQLLPKELAKQYNVGVSQISYIKLGKAWKHVL